MSKFNPVTATHLPNGARILMRANVNGEWVWLAQWAGGYTGLEWVTWRGNAKGETYWGRYKRSLHAGREDFFERVHQLSSTLQRSCEGLREIEAAETEQA